MTGVDEYLEKGASEFEDAYDDEPVVNDEVFSAVLLEETVEVLSPPKPQCVSPQTKVSDVIRGMAERNQGCVLVVENEVLVGVFTERDVMRRAGGKIDKDATPISEIMTPDPEAVSFHDTIAVVLNKMTIGGFRHVPLVDIRMHPVGVVSIRDVVQYFVDRFPNHVLNVPPDPLVRHPEQIGAG